jgi:CheY-like chemotaxis protein
MVDVQPSSDPRDLEDRPLKVLVVDDHEINRRVMQAIMLEYDCPVALAACGREAVDSAYAEAYDLIVMDRCMPGGVDGDMATQAIRACGRSTGAYIALWTTDAPARLNRALYDDELCKPINCEAVGTLVERVRERGRLPGRFVFGMRG